MDEIIDLLEEIGLPYVYDHFAEGEAPVYPCICFRISNDNPFYADGITYYLNQRVYFELHNLKKDPQVESVIRNVLNTNNIAYKCDEEYLETYDAYRIVYSFNMEV